MGSERETDPITTAPNKPLTTTARGLPLSPPTAKWGKMINLPPWVLPHLLCYGLSHTRTDLRRIIDLIKTTWGALPKNTQCDIAAIIENELRIYNTGGSLAFLPSVDFPELVELQEWISTQTP